MKSVPSVHIYMQELTSDHLIISFLFYSAVKDDPGHKS